MDNGKWYKHKSPTGDYALLSDGTENPFIGRIDRHFNIDLIITAVNACKSINPENPMAVAEKITEICKLLEQMSETDTVKHWLPGYFIELKDLLSDIKEKP